MLTLKDIANKIVDVAVEEFYKRSAGGWFEQQLIFSQIDWQERPYNDLELKILIETTLKERVQQRTGAPSRQLFVEILDGVAPHDVGEKVVYFSFFPPMAVFHHHFPLYRYENSGWDFNRVNYNLYTIVPPKRKEIQTK